MEYSIGSASSVSPGHYFQEGNFQQVKLIKSLLMRNHAYSLLPTQFVIYADSESIIFDELTGETICSHCAIVISDKQTTFENDHKLKSDIGQPTSLVFPDKGLSTVITSSNTDANGTSLNQDQITSINKIRYYDKLSGSKNQSRNLRNAFAVMAATKDKLTLTDPVIERAAYYYRKTLDSKLIKGQINKRDGGRFNICGM